MRHLCARALSGLLVASFLWIGLSRETIAQDYLKDFPIVRYPVDVADLKALAQDIRVFLYIERNLLVIPILSPANREWLVTEMTASIERNMIVTASSEYALWQARNYVELVDLHTRNILESDGYEYKDWILLLDTLIDADRVQYLGLVCERASLADCPIQLYDGSSQTSVRIANNLAQRIVREFMWPYFGVREKPN